MGLRPGAFRIRNYYTGHSRNIYRMFRRLFGICFPTKGPVLEIIKYNRENIALDHYSETSETMFLVCCAM